MACQALAGRARLDPFVLSVALTPLSRFILSVGSIPVRPERSEAKSKDALFPRDCPEVP